jgi:hypothetical protein
MNQCRKTFIHQLIKKLYHMKRNVLYNLALLPMALLITTLSMSQTGLAEDQNPNYMVSQAKYTQMADSINSWHGTTPQETYKAIDYYADKLEWRATRKAFRRQLRLERARNGYYYGYDNYPSYYGYNNYNPYYGYGYYGYRHPVNQFLSAALPVAATIALLSWCR